MPNPVSSVTAGSGNPLDNTSARVPQNTLTQKDFLKLLISQMTAQDPLNPQSNTDFAAQMAQFSALQSSQSTQAGVSLLQASQLIQQANSLIGRNVTLQAASGAIPSGVVSGVQMLSGAPKIVVNGVPYDLNQVMSISSPVNQPLTP